MTYLYRRFEYERNFHRFELWIQVIILTSLRLSQRLH
jgi:hypothetical protein